MKLMRETLTLIMVVAAVLVSSAVAGPYNELGIAGYIGVDGRHADPAAGQVNPIFRNWATKVVDYRPAEDVGSLYGVCFNDPNRALGPATGLYFTDVVSLGELHAADIAAGDLPGSITLGFGNPADPNDLSDPQYAIHDGAGYDFAVFENGFVDSGEGDGHLGGTIFAEFAYVEVSSDGTNFARFSAVSLVEEPESASNFLCTDVTLIHNLAGKHPNYNGVCKGTAFDLDELAAHEMVLGGLVDLQAIRYVRLVDVPGSGDYFDDAANQVDPYSGPGYVNFGVNHAIYDPWMVASPAPPNLPLSSGGFDLEAIGVLCPQQYRADINLDGVVDLGDFQLLCWAWQGEFGSDDWFGRCDLAEPCDMVIDSLDLAVMADEWLAVELWCVD